MGIFLFAAQQCAALRLGQALATEPQLGAYRQKAAILVARWWQAAGRCVGKGIGATISASNCRNDSTQKRGFGMLPSVFGKRASIYGGYIMNKPLTAIFVASLLPTPLLAQVAQSVPVAQTQPIAATQGSSAASNAVLRAGSAVQLRLMEAVTTKKKAARVGQRFMLEVAAPVEVNGVVVIPAGTPAWGEITEVRNKGMWGKSGQLKARLLYLRVNGRQIRLTGSFDDKGVTGTAGVVGAIAFVPVAGFFMTGTSAEFPKGGEVGGFIDEDVQLAIANVEPAPMQVSSTPAPMSVAPASPAPTEEEK